MQRYFISRENWKETEKVSIFEDAHHISRVMRNKPGEEIICVHPENGAAVCVITAIEEGRVDAEVRNWLEENKELPVRVTIAQGLPKGDKLELILQKGTELGVSSLLPFQAARSIVKWDKKKSAKKMERLKKIAKEASEQSHRTQIPALLPFYDFSELLANSKDYDLCIFAYEEEAKGTRSKGLSEILEETVEGHKILACIGPEGGFTIEEASALKENGFLPVRLGPRILRTETAPLYLLSCISYHFEELRC